MRTPDRSVSTLNPKPQDDELDVFGLSHAGKVRAENQDHFLLATIHKRVHIHLTNLTQQQRLPMEDERLAVFAMVADGVGGGENGDEASATALEVAMHYMADSTDCYYRADGSDEQFIQLLQDAALKSHEAVIARAREVVDGRTMATTLTLWMGVWPYCYLLQVGDSRYYLYREGELTQVSRDQTIAQELLDQGVFTRAMAARSQYANVLSSAIGGDAATPVVTRMRSDWRNVHLLCTDGLTKHVPDELIRDRLANMTSARQVCEQLLDDALQAGGTDNVSIIVGRSIQKK
ncbi:MAG: protein phosphatase 2C domain-containing protein [Gemmatimonadota bacterium]|nr:protein phosphatase 2C domain-containing protein [Gemmatimonadota bacterium]